MITSIFILKITLILIYFIQLKLILVSDTNLDILIMEKAIKFQKNIYFCFIDYAKAFDCVDHKKLENSEQDGNIVHSQLSPPYKRII